MASHHFTGDAKASHPDQEAGAPRRSERPSQHAYLAERSPLLRPMSQPAAGTLCTCGVVAVLAISWCILDFWNRKLSDDLFSIGDVRMLDTSGSHKVVVAPFNKFSYPLTLAFLQFLFMAVAFLIMHWAITQQSPSDLNIASFTSDRRWPVLVASHVFSTFWLQSLMMPTQVMSLGFFAASRGIEIPMAAALRTPVLGSRFGKKTMQTTGLAFVAACTLYFGYAQLAGCMCILSGNGVSLTGAAFWVIYALLLAMPAINAVYQEAILVQDETHPLLILALQNVFAALLFGPILLTFHVAGWEDVGAAFQMILSHQAILMLVLWLCAQIALTSIVCIMIIQVIDSFWAIALRALRVAFWGMNALIPFYVSNSGIVATGIPLSIACPRSSFWSFVILCGVGLVAAAVYTDRKAEDERPIEKGSASAGASAAEKVASKVSA